MPSLTKPIDRGFAFRRAAFVSAALLLLSGCGGGSEHRGATGSGATTVVSSGASAQRSSASARFAVAWPERVGGSVSRLIPVAANSIKITVQNGDTLVGSVVIPRPGDATAGMVTSALIENLPEGALTVTASACPNGDGTGVTQASATLPVTLSAGELKDVPLTLASAIDHIEVASLNKGDDPVPFVWRRDTIPVMATARDASGAAVITALDKWQWTSADPTRATIVSASGNTVIVKAGTTVGATNLSVRETESGKQGTLTVKVRGYNLTKLSDLPKTDRPYSLINSAGQIAGSYSDSTSSYAWVWTPTTAGATTGTVSHADPPNSQTCYSIIGLSNSGNIIAQTYNNDVKPNRSYFVFYELSRSNSPTILQAQEDMPIQDARLSNTALVGFAYRSAGVDKGYVVVRWPNAKSVPDVVSESDEASPRVVQVSDNGVIFAGKTRVRDVSGTWHTLAAPSSYSGSITGLTVQADGTALGYYPRAEGDYAICRWDATGSVQVVGTNPTFLPSIFDPFIVQAGNFLLGPKYAWDTKAGRSVRYSDVLQEKPPLDISGQYFAGLTGASSSGRLFLAYTTSDVVDFYALDPVE